MKYAIAEDFLPLDKVRLGFFGCMFCKSRLLP